ncbi:putative nucleolar complex protein 14 [Candida viswanathii]|uniref:Putative nucleolar complex protein 14 n=1 Tax=Candida viswanathii TaxID=5486 RepID=A0A367XZG3_9ASCO|nr:putative nucleolar complex protein 14 [Candida viswanathii]
MAGSQLKQLKAALKDKGLIGQTNTSKKSKKSKTSNRNETNRDEKQQKLNEIREQFNKFDNKINRSKHDISIIHQGKFVKVGSKQHNATVEKNGSIQRQMKMQYDLEKRQKGKSGGILDKRFGENDSHLTKEEKMLARFTKERQAASSKKRNVFSLASDDEQLDMDDEDDGFALTHAGHALSLDDEETIKYVDEDSLEPPRKKSKNEVMKEIIAKSKFYKQQRQKEFAKTQDQIDELDEDFGDVMDDLRSIQGKVAGSGAFSAKTPEQIEYDSKVRELTYDRRAVPADRTKTQEELRKEYDEKMKKLEADRLRRMEGFVDDDRDQQGDDLDDDFWGGDDSENEENGFTIKESDNEEDEEEGEEEENVKPRKLQAVVMPFTFEEFLEEITAIEPGQQLEYIRKICNDYKPGMGQGNKEKMGNFTGIVFEYILHLADHFQDFEPFVKILKKLAESYNEPLVEKIREHIKHMQGRINKPLKASDLVFFVIIPYLYSASDHYHIVITPCLILMNEILSTIIYHPRDIASIAQGVFLVDVLLMYQRFAKRYDPEVISFIEHAVFMLVPEPEKLDASSMLSISEAAANNVNVQFSMNKAEKFADSQTASLSVKQLYSEDVSKPLLLGKLVSLMDKCVTLWKEKSSLVEVLASFISILKHITKYNATLAGPLLTRFTKLHDNLVKDRKPLTLQHHRALAIATFAPKFEENYNPDKKFYDINRERQELDKIKHQVKKEKKAALKDIRQENRFRAREQISEKKSMYDEYHKKMANIYNTIQSEEGAEKNQYEREKKQRKRR